MIILLEPCYVKRCVGQTIQKKETTVAMATRGRSREHGKNSRNDLRSKSRVKKGSQSDDIVAN